MEMTGKWTEKQYLLQAVSAQHPQLLQADILGQICIQGDNASAAPLLCSVHYMVKGE